MMFFIIIIKMKLSGFQTQLFVQLYENVNNFKSECLFCTYSVATKLVTSQINLLSQNCARMLGQKSGVNADCQLPSLTNSIRNYLFCN